MNVLIDASSLMKELTGIGVYVRELLDHMIPLDQSIHYTIFMNSLKGSTPAFSWVNQDNVTLVRRRFPGKILLELWRRNWPPSIEKLAGVKPDLFHSPNFYYQNSRARRNLATVHDLAFLKRSDYGGRYSGQYHRETLIKNISNISHFTVVSHAVKKDLMSLCQVPADKISVIHHGMNSVFKPAFPIEQQTQHHKRLGYPDQYLLSVGTIEPRKNLPLLVRAYGRIASHFPDLHLVIVGRFADGFSELEQAVIQSDYSDRISLNGYAPFETLLKLYQGATAAVFPSWDEGFGFPALEAAACGTPVFASDIPVHREILGDSAWFFRPDCVEALETVLLAQLNDKAALKARRQSGLDQAKKYTWTAAAKKHIEIYRTLST